MVPESFKSKFKTLLEEAEELVNNTPDRDLEEMGIPLLPVPLGIICKNEKEFENRMVRLICGHTKIYISLPEEEYDPAVVEIRQDLMARGFDIIKPSLMIPTNRADSFEPYVLFFTKDNRLFMYPVRGKAFKAD